MLLSSIAVLLPHLSSQFLLCSNQWHPQTFPKDPKNLSIKEMRWQIYSESRRGYVKEQNNKTLGKIPLFSASVLCFSHIVFDSKFSSCVNSFSSQPSWLVCLHYIRSAIHRIICIRLASTLNLLSAFPLLIFIRSFSSKSFHFYHFLGLHYRSI